MRKPIDLGLKWIDPLPPASGKRQTAIRRDVARAVAYEALGNHIASVHQNAVARMQWGMAARDQMLEPEDRVDYHVVGLRIHQVVTRREYPYGRPTPPTMTVLPGAQRLARLQAALARLSSRVGYELTIDDVIG